MILLDFNYNVQISFQCVFERFSVLSKRAEDTRILDKKRDVNVIHLGHECDYLVA